MAKKEKRFEVVFKDGSEMKEEGNSLLDSPIPIQYENE